jgi:hypothetical protein
MIEISQIADNDIREDRTCSVYLSLKETWVNPAKGNI